MADIAKINGLNLKDAAARADIATAKTDIATAKTDIAGLKESVIKEISSQYIRITDYDTGVYKLTYNGPKRIYYKGSTNTAVHIIGESATTLMLTINKMSENSWTWYYFLDNKDDLVHIYCGTMTTTSGNVNSSSLPSGEFKALATTDWATTSKEGLMSAADKAKLNKVYTEKVFKEANFSTSGGDSGTTKYFHMEAEFDNTTKTVRITGTMKVTYANSSGQYALVAVSLINSKLGSPGISTSTFKSGRWWGQKEADSTLDLFGYGTGISIQQTSYLGFGRFYTTSFGYGNWAADTFKNSLVNSLVHFEMVFSYTGIAS